LRRVGGAVVSAFPNSSKSQASPASFSAALEVTAFRRELFERERASTPTTPKQPIELCIPSTLSAP
jgi:hypothetical protein